jgi:hypothetical protein
LILLSLPFYLPLSLLFSPSYPTPTVPHFFPHPHLSSFSLSPSLLTPLTFSSPSPSPSILLCSPLVNFSLHRYPLVSSPLLSSPHLFITIPVYPALSYRVIYLPLLTSSLPISPLYHYPLLSCSIIWGDISPSPHLVSPYHTSLSLSPSILLYHIG